MKLYTIETTRKGRTSTDTGTFADLLNSFDYTLLVGESYQHEKGNKKINRHPKSIKALVTNLNKAASNSAANGAASSTFEQILVAVTPPVKKLVVKKEVKKEDVTGKLLLQAAINKAKTDTKKVVKKAVKKVEDKKVVKKVVAKKETVIVKKVKYTRIDSICDAIRKHGIDTAYKTVSATADKFYQAKTGRKSNLVESDALTKRAIAVALNLGLAK